MTASDRHRAFVIVGGGIAGLATALAIAPHASSVTVLERSPRFHEIGAGMQLSPNAFAALAELGVKDDVLAHAIRVESLSVLDAQSGDTLISLPLDDRFEAEFGGPYAVVHRGALHRTLLDACRRTSAIRLVTNAEVNGVTEFNDSIAANLADGTTVAGDALIGADGLHSVVRARVIGDGAPVPAGHVVYRAVIAAERFPEDLPAKSSVLWAGPGMHVVHYPLADGTSFNVVATRVEPVDEMFANREVDPVHVRTAFADVAAPLRRLLDVPPQWRAWSIADRMPVDTWHLGRAMLIGDAAHPMLQYAAQGACQALEDAVVLARLVATLDAIDAIASLGSVRAARTARVQQTARWLGEAIYHPAEASRHTRDVMLAALDEEALMSALRWLYSWTPDDARAIFTKTPVTTRSQ